MRRSLIVALAVLAALAACHTGFWWWATTRAEAELQIWATARRAQGWLVAMGAPQAGGWPLAATVSAADVRITAPLMGLPGTVSVSAAQASGGVRFLDPRRVMMHLDGAMQVQLGDGPVIPFTADHLGISVPLAAGPAPSEADVVVDNLRVGPAAPAAWLAVSHAHGLASWHPAAAKGEAALSVLLQAGPTLLPPEPLPGAPAQLWALGNRIDRLDVRLTVNGPVPRVPSPSISPAQWAALWRDGGGIARIDLAALDWGRLGASGTATLALDATLQPAGTATLRVSGFGETLDALAAAHILPPRTATTAKAVLSIMARPQEAGPAVVEAPLSVQDRTLQFGRIPLARMPELQWSAVP